MNYIFSGTEPIAELCLQEILYSGAIHCIPTGIVSSADNLRLFEPYVKVSKLLLSKTSKSEFQLFDLINKVSPDFLISVQHPWIFSSSILNMVSSRAFNIHNAKLPDYRGHNTITYEILNDDRIHVSTLHQMAETVDMGKLIKTEEIDILLHDTAYSLWQRSVPSCVELFRWFVVESNYLHADQYAKPIQGLGRYYRKDQINVDKHVPSGSDINILCRYARAFCFPPHEPAYLLCGKTKVHLTPIPIDDSAITEGYL